MIFIFEHDEFGNAFSQDDYADLFSNKSNELGNKYDLSKNFFKYFSVTEFKTRALIRKLDEAKNNPHKLPNLLKEFYSLYCSGYATLQSNNVHVFLKHSLHYCLIHLVSHDTSCAWL